MWILSLWLQTGRTWFTPESKAFSASTSSLLFPALVVWHRDPCLLNRDLMPKVWSAQLTMELIEKPAVCLSALSEASQTLKDTHFIDISGTWYLCGLGTCVGTGGRTASGTTRNWAVKYSKKDWQRFKNKKNKLEKEAHLSADTDSGTRICIGKQEMNYSRTLYYSSYMVISQLTRHF